MISEAAVNYAVRRWELRMSLDVYHQGFCAV